MTTDRPVRFLPGLEQAILKAMKCLWVYMTAPTAAVARRLVRGVVEARLAACGNILPRVRSIYRWKGRVESGAETVVVLKTTVHRWPELAAELRRQHPYECPCIVAMEIRRGFPPFLKWIADSCGPDRPAASGFRQGTQMSRPTPLIHRGRSALMG